MLVLSKKHTKGLERWSNNKAFALLAEEPSIYFETLIEDLTYNLDPGKSTVFFLASEITLINMAYVSW